MLVSGAGARAPCATGLAAAGTGRLGKLRRSAHAGGEAGLADQAHPLRAMRSGSVAVQPVRGDVSGLVAENFGQQSRAAGAERVGEDDSPGGRPAAAEASFQPGTERYIDVM